MELESYFDISPEISETIAVFPGDRPYRRGVSLDFDSGANLLLSGIDTTLHLGAHADAPNHYHRGGQGIGECDLKRYFGRSQVVSVKVSPGERVLPAHLAGVRIHAPRVLFRTGSFPDPRRWNSDFNSLSPELIDWLADQGIVLVGIDTPSLDPESSKALETHQAIFRRGISNLEGLVLDVVPDGIYTLVALPLRLRDADASPVRAILIRGNE